MEHRARHIDVVRHLEPSTQKMTPRKQRFFFLLGTFCLACGAVALILYGAKDSLVYFYTPSDIKTKNIKHGQTLRIGGMVADDSLTHTGEFIQFELTDGMHSVTILYQGILPDLFREGQGVVAEGVMNEKKFIAKKILAKHDENYMPPEVARNLKTP